eukprot:10991000-Alexandrium_andersonii.AAC.1
MAGDGALRRGKGIGRRPPAGDAARGAGRASDLAGMLLSHAGGASAPAAALKLRVLLAQALLLASLALLVRPRPPLLHLRLAHRFA